MTFLEALDEMRKGKTVQDKKTGDSYFIKQQVFLKFYKKDKLVMDSVRSFNNLAESDWQLAEGGEDE